MKEPAKRASQSSVTLERQPEGATLLFVAEPRNAEEQASLQELFDDLRQGCRVLTLALGPITAYAVRTQEEIDPQELASLLETVAPSYRGRVEIGFNPSYYRNAIEEVALETGSDLLVLDHCDLCHQPDPFPTRIALNARGERVEGLYCERCVARLADGGEREMVEAFLFTDTDTFGLYRGLRLNSRPVRQGNRIRFTTRPSEERVAATG